MKKKILFQVVTLLMTFFYQSYASDNFVSKEKFKGFTPVDKADPIAIPQSVQNKINALKDSLANNIAILKLLPYETTSIVITKISGDGSLSFATAEVTAKGESYKTIYEYSLYDLVVDNGKTYKVGICVRVVADFKSLGAGLKIGSIFGVNADFKFDKISGQLLVEKIGINSTSITNLYPSIPEINPTTIQEALKQTAVIKSKVGDKETFIIPDVIGVVNANQTNGTGAQTPNATHQAK